MHIDTLIYQLEELRGRHEDLRVYVFDPDYGWEDFSLEIVERPKGINPYDGVANENKWVGIR
jgi:hypothetical protein